MIKKRSSKRAREVSVTYLSRILDKPMIFLSFAWLFIMVVQLVSDRGQAFEGIMIFIWILFGIQFVIEFSLTPEKIVYLKRNWITALSLVLPALRLFRFTRVFRFLKPAGVARSLSLVRILTSLNRGMRALRRTLKKSGFGYVVAMTVIVIFAGAAGMNAFENPNALESAGINDVRGLQSYGDSLWWTAMMITTIASEYWPHTAEGRILGWLLGVYAMTVFGYITATIARHFITQDK